MKFVFIYPMNSIHYNQLRAHLTASYLQYIELFKFGGGLFFPALERLENRKEEPT
jgi:hypothetical protein